MFVFLARSSFDHRHRPLKSSRFGFTASSCPILPVTFCHVLRKEGNHEENESGEREHKEMMIRIHQRMSCGLSVSHTSHSITRNTPLLPNLAKNHQPRHSPWLIQVHQLRPSVMLKNTPTRDLLVRHWWPFPPLPSLLSVGDVFCLLSLDHLDKTSREKKRTVNMRIKTRKWTEEKVIFRNQNFLSNERSNEIRKRRRNNWKIKEG